VYVHAQAKVLMQPHQCAVQNDKYVHSLLVLAHLLLLLLLLALLSLHMCDMCDPGTWRILLLLLLAPQR
jgi:hypothetical protein